MAKTAVIDELHVTVRVPADLPESEAGTVRRALLGEDFLRRLRGAVRAAVRAFPELTRCRVSLTR